MAQAHMSRVTSPQVEEASKQKKYNVPCHFLSLNVLNRKVCRTLKHLLNALVKQMVGGREKFPVC